MANSSKFTQAQAVKVHNTAMECVKHLATTKGLSITQAEDAVMETLRESQAALLAGQADTVIATLKMIHMDASPAAAAQDIISKLFA